MNPFEQMVNELFMASDFLEPLTVDGKTIDVASYVARNAEEYTEYGSNPGNAVEVMCKVTDWQPSRGQLVTFRGKTFKVSEYDADSHALCYKVYLKNQESK